MKIFCFSVVICLGMVNLVCTSQSVVDELREEIEKLKATTSKALKKAENKIQSLTARIDEMEQEKHSQRKDLDRKRFVLSNPLAEKPAFTASLGNHSMNLGNYQNIVFENVFTNDLGSYSPVTGYFTAPVDGTYFFTATVMSHYGQYLETEIALNGKPLVYMYSYDTKHEQGTNSVVLVLKTGDSVCVRHTNTQGNNAYGYNWSSFTGFMI